MAFEYIKVENGLSSNRIQFIYRDHKDFVWIGTTENGLNKFDGYNVVSYEHDDNNLNSLSSNFVHCILEDRQHNLWIGTFDGLNLYNSYLDNFTVFRNDKKDLSSISSNCITSIKEGKKGDVWIGTAYNGLNKWNPASRNFIRYKADSLINRFNNEITDFAEDSEGNLWIVNRQSGITFFNSESEIFSFYADDSVGLDNIEKTILIDNQDNIWIGSKGGGFCLFDWHKHIFTHFNNKSGYSRPNSTIVDVIISDDENHLLLGTDQGGINRFNKKNHIFQYILSNGYNPDGLNNNGIVSLYKDKEGILWVGTTRGGVNYYNPKRNKFKKYLSGPVIDGIISNNIIGCFYEDHEGMIWIGTDGGGVLVFNPDTEQFIKSFVHKDSNSYSISGNVIRSIQEDKNGALWISTWDKGLNRYERKSGRFYHYLPDSKGTYKIADRTIWNMKIDRNNNVWLGTFNAGVEVLNKEKGIIKRYNTQGRGSESISSNNISFLYEDAQKFMWICTNYGVNCLDIQHNKITTYTGFPDNNIRSFCKDKNGNYWAGSVNKGLFKFNEKGNVQEVYNKKSGLPDNTINAIIDDDNNNLWITTKKGLSRLDINTKQIKNYYESDGLACNSFFEQSFLKTKQGEIYIGGDRGFNSFYPDSISDNDYVSKVYLTDFKLFNKSIPIGREGKILSQHISETKKITLSWKQSSFSFDFIAINYTSPDQNQYAYKLEGFDENWNYVGNKKEATYTNINPGDYLFKVKLVNDGVLQSEETSIFLSILPPFWKTIYAYLLYGFVCLGLFLLSWRIIRGRERLKYAVEKEKQRSLRDRELDLMKIKFFTNVSHDFRTPLSLVISPLKRIIQQETDPKKTEHLKLVYRNAKRLLNLVDQLLDFRKIEVGKLKLNKSVDDIIFFTKELFSSFTDLSLNRGITTSYQSNVNELFVSFDKDKLEKILLNLISNAFKFTLDNGRIDLMVNLTDRRISDKYVEVKIEVKDTGIGMAYDRQSKIFKPFFQNQLPESIINKGSGIGLSITYEFVKLFGGTIEVSSEPNIGSCFTVRLPLELENNRERSVNNIYDELPLDQKKIGIVVLTHKEESIKPSILLVEDEEDFLFYLKDNLGVNYNIIEAKNGKDAWEKTLKKLPDLIISDVMMPLLDGLEFCSLVKKDKRTSHIPVVLLTAKASEENEIEGLHVGADDYLRKPFSFEILESRIRNIITQRELLKEAFHKQVIVKPADIKITSMDEKLLQQALLSVEKNISNVNFSVEELSDELGISRGYLYHKLLAITGYSPVEFIRLIRIKRAKQLLEESQLSIAEIAYQVGFNNPKLFTKYFKQEFQVTPSQFKKSRSNI